MERGMKSDKTEMVLLGAAAAVIALVVAFSMMGDKGKRSLDDDDPDETTRNVRQKVEEVEAKVEDDVAKLEDAAKKIDSNLSRAKEALADLKGNVDPASRPGRLVNAAERAVNGLTGAGETVSRILGPEKTEELKEAAADKVKAAGQSALNYLREAAGKKFEQHKPKTGFFGNLFSKPKETPLPPNVRGGSREVRL